MRVVLPCDVCGIEMSRCPSQIHKYANTCSRKCQAEWQKTRIHSEEHRRKNSENRRGVSPSSLEGYSRAQKKKWREGVFDRAFEGRASKLEKELITWIGWYGFTYTGSGESRFRISSNNSTKIPDYTHFEKQLVFELWGDYWHRGQDPQGLVDWYAEAGWTAIVVWVSKLNDFIVDRRIDAYCTTSAA